MRDLEPATHCRLSGESLSDSTLLFELTDCPLPGLYPFTADESAELRTPLKVVQARNSGLVQLAHIFDPANYTKYSFSGGVSSLYRQHLEKIVEIFQSLLHSHEQCRILEIGCGDGALLSTFEDRGYRSVYGIDPSEILRTSSKPNVATGFFPTDLPERWRKPPFDAVILRHVLEHLEQPEVVLRHISSVLDTQGILCIEVPDLDSTLRQSIWSNFYQLHCSYFNVATLDRLLAANGFRPIVGEIVEIFGGSILRFYNRIGPAEKLPTAGPVGILSDRVAEYQQALRKLTQRLPQGSVGYGAAERTAMTIGLCPSFEQHLVRLHDRNPLICDRFLAGTRLKIHSCEELYTALPPAIVVFAISNVAEILKSFRDRLPHSTLVATINNPLILKPLESFL